MSGQTWPGARWWKFDFHTHTPSSQDTSDWQRAKGTPDEVTHEKWLLKYMAAGVDCVVVTDHNSAGWIDELKAANQRLAASPPAGFRPLTIFPGVELSVSGGLHILAVFDPATPADTIKALLGAVDYPPNLHGHTDGRVTAACTGKSLKDVLAAIKKPNMGGLVIAAHADKDKGLLNADCNSRRHAIEIGVDALEIIDLNVTKPQTYIEKSPHWAQVVGSDCHSFQGQAVPGSRFTWVKMAAPTIDGLRLALHDGNGVSVLRHDDPQASGFDPDKIPDHLVSAISVTNMQVMGNGQPLRLECNPFFNAIIGGRGTGKSTIVHALRLAFRREEELKSLPEKGAARTTFERFNNIPRSRQDREGGGLRPNSQVQVELVRDGQRYRLGWTKDGPSTVEEWDGAAWKASASQNINPERFHIRIFSQGQIADLAGENQQALLDLIDAAAAVRPLREEGLAVIRSYLTQQAKIREYDGRLTKRDVIKVQLEDVVRKLAKLEGSDHAAILRTFQQFRQQDHEVTHAFSNADELRSKMSALEAHLVLDDIQLAAFDQATDADILRTMANLHQAVSAAQAKVHEAGDTLRAAIENLRLHAGTEAWQKRQTAARLAYEKLQADLANQGITDPGVYGQLVQQRQLLTTQLQQLDSIAAERTTAVNYAEQLLLEVHAARASITKARALFLADKLASNAYVRITIEPHAEEVGAAERRLRERIEVTDRRFESDIYEVDPSHVKPAIGFLADWDQKSDRRAAEATVRDLLVRAAQGQDGVSGKLRNNLKERADKDPAFIDHLRCFSFEDGLRVEASRRGDGQDFQPIEQASAGQRAAAILAFLLSHGDEPLVLDQPEDDLDNHMIYELIVQQIRANKLRRQLIIVTHNPNIVVNGDAELVHALDFRGGQCVVTESGALQQRAIRVEVCHVMEGGPEAFRRRWQRLGEERTHV